jgi:hypothetical protein
VERPSWDRTNESGVDAGGGGGGAGAVEKVQRKEIPVGNLVATSPRKSCPAGSVIENGGT